MNAIEFKGVTKKFGDFYANRDLSFAVKTGTIHGLVGENGAGKSTAMKALFGIHPLDSGEIQIRGEKIRIKSPVHAMRVGVGMVHQHFMLAASETVLDNILLGHEMTFASVFLRRDQALAEVEKISKAYGLHFTKWFAPVRELSVGEQQRVEILKLLYQKSNILILDEPTAVLTPQEVKRLFHNLQRLKAEGKTIILISHKLKEVLEFTDEVTVMRRGEGVGTKLTRETNENELAQMMVGRPVSFSYAGARTIAAQGSEARALLQVKELSITGGPEPLKNVSFSLKPGEILGVAGVQGNGQSELLRYLANPKRFLKRAEGEYLLKRKFANHCGPVELRRLGVGLVPEDRLSEGLLLHQDMTENFLLGQHEDPRYLKSGFLKRAYAKKVLGQKIKDFDIRPAHPNAWAERMSGGNQQKLVIARALDADPEILFIAHPTRGVDVGAIEKIHESIVTERNKGRGVLLFSSELDELVDLCDRILVFYNGQIKAEYGRREFDIWEIGRVMGGGEK